MWSVLFVDDEPRVLEGLENLMFPFMDEWQLGFAESGAQALELLKTARFNVLVTDMRMPGMDGATLLHKVKHDHPGVVRIVLSGHSEVEAAMRAMPVAHQFLGKPCDAQTLLRVLTEARRLGEVISDGRIQAAIGDIEQLPARPQIYERLWEILRDENWSVKDVAQAIEQDMAIATKVLHVANTAFFYRGNFVVDLPTAVSRLGASLIKSLVLGFETYGSFGSEVRLDVDAMHTAGVKVGALAKRMLSGKSADDAFLAGLLHDVGRAIIAKSLPEAAKRIANETQRLHQPLEVSESGVLGVTHAEIGAYLLGLWGMPYRVLDAVCRHHDAECLAQGELGVAQAVYLAATLQEAVDQGTTPVFNPDHVTQLGLSHQLSEWTNLLREEWHGQL